MLTISRSDYIYTALFCEENIWHLADSLIKQGVKSSDLDVIFISNKKQQVAIFNQKVAPNHHPVIWDYHVVLLRKTDSDYLIYDYDTVAAFETPAKQYLDLSFPTEVNIKPAYQAQFRFIKSQTYLKGFSSDRSHMLGIIDINQFPDYPPIQAKDNQQVIYFHQLTDFNLAHTDDEALLTTDIFKELVDSK